jgi:hypothetical protein
MYRKIRRYKKSKNQIAVPLPYVGREVHGEDVLVKKAAALFREKRKWSNLVR